MSDTLSSDKKTSTKKVDKGTDEKADPILSDKIPFTKGVDKGTDELEFKKQKAHTICRKGLNQFEGQSTGTQGWFKLDIEFKKTTYSKGNQEFYKELLNKIEYQYTEVYETFVVPFDK